MNRFSLLIPRIVNRFTVCRFNSTTATASTSASTQPPPPPLDIPAGSNEPRVFSPKIQTLVDQIAQLNLLEVADLNECLKVIYFIFYYLL